MLFVYLPYETESHPDDLIELLVEHANRKRCRLVLGCDANSHHTKCICHKYQILNFIILNRFNICNAGNKPTFRNCIREAVIDITLSNMDRSVIRD